MFSELKKSVNYIIYERTTSPFWGTFIFSWLICNWKIIFTVFVVSESEIAQNKIDFISDNFIGWKPLIFYPFISSAILILVFPLIGNGAYWMTLIYSEWRIRKKNAVEKKQLLSLEASIALRSANKLSEENYVKSLEEKEQENTILRLEVKELERRLQEPAQELITNISNNQNKSEHDEWDIEFEKLTKTSRYNEFKSLLIDLVSNSLISNYNVNYNVLVYFTAIDIIEKTGNHYELTKKGKYFSKRYNEDEFGE
jgi:hypothetical protein